MGFRITTSHAESVATEIQRLLAEMKIKPQHFRISMVGMNSVVEFQADVGHRAQEKIVEQVNRAGVVTEIVPFEGHRE
jgi:type IV secretory pathway ATPase VirB11/archaellum biosynthesis ATPase